MRLTAQRLLASEAVSEASDTNKGASCEEALAWGSRVSRAGVLRLGFPWRKG